MVVGNIQEQAGKKEKNKNMAIKCDLLRMDR